jgi:valyl-tRNA synthetase
MSFGTGAVKITPAHDPNDFATGKRHDLEFINMLTEDGLVNDEGGDAFKGMKRFTARRAIVEALDEKGLYRGKADNPMRLGLCSRSKDVIEPMLKPQWWVNCQQMAADACEAARSKELEILPPFMEPTWFRWLENIRDWCISRQLWWGHRIPAYYVRFDDETEDAAGMPGGSSEQLDRWVIGREEDEARIAATEKFPGRAFTLEQDEDVLDTWFSSGLFPFSVFGWPDESPDLAEFYPTSLLETGHDILFFWVARMVMMGMKLTGKVPFKQVYLHAMVRDAHGRKMSKSLGNVIDPLHVIEGISLPELNKTLEGGNLEEKEIKKAAQGQAQDYPDGIPQCGTDAMRFALVAYTAQGRDINLDVLRVVGYRHWCNKMWNAIRFAMMNLGEGYAPPETPLTCGDARLPPASRWALSRFNHAAKVTVEAMEVYGFNDATTAVYAFWQYDVCDVFIELVKPVVNGDDENAKKATRDTLWTCLDGGLRLLHPFMPFVTEELWQRLPRRKAESAPSIMIADYPAHAPERVDAVVEAQMAIAQETVKATRSLRAASRPRPSPSCSSSPAATTRRRRSTRSRGTSQPSPGARC